MRLPETKPLGKHVFWLIVTVTVAGAYGLWTSLFEHEAHRSESVDFAVLPDAGEPLNSAHRRSDMQSDIGARSIHGRKRVNPTRIPGEWLNLPDSLGAESLSPEEDQAVAIDGDGVWDDSSIEEEIASSEEAIRQQVLWELGESEDGPDLAQSPEVQQALVEEAQFNERLLSDRGTMRRIPDDPSEERMLELEPGSASDDPDMENPSQ